MQHTYVYEIAKHSILRFGTLYCCRLRETKMGLDGRVVLMGKEEN